MITRRGWEIPPSKVPGEAPVNSTAETSKPALGGAAIPAGYTRLLDAAAVAVGSILMVITAINQPYNQNEIQQVAPYGSSDLAKITGATRQPPLDPVLGAIVQHLLGEGQLRQRLVPILAGIGSLVLMLALLRRLGTGAGGTVALWVMATAPLMLRYSAYARPYSLPVFLMMLFVYAAQGWLDDRRRRWLLVTAIAAVAMPLARVPEPTVFLGATALTMLALSLRRRVSWSQTGPLIAISSGAVVLVCYPLYRSLASKAASIWDPSPSGVAERFGTGVHEVLTGLLPLLASWLPWWPITLAVIVAAFTVGDCRRRLMRWWFFWPLLAGPLLFVVAYHFMNPFSFEVRPYRARMAIFFVPEFALVVAALATAATDAVALGQRMRAGIAVLVAAALLAQLPATGVVLVANEAPDFGQVADVLTEQLPDDAIVLYDTASKAGQWRQPFSARPRYMSDTPYVEQVGKILHHPHAVPTKGPVYVLLLDSQCAVTVVCDEPRAVWSHRLRGWEVFARFDRFTLYEPQSTLRGRAGVISALRQFARAMGPDLGYVETFSAASLLRLAGHPGQGRRLIRQMYRAADPEAADRIRAAAAKHDLDPYA